MTQKETEKSNQKSAGMCRAFVMLYDRSTAGYGRSSKVN